MATQTAWAGEVFRTTVESLLLLLAMVMWLVQLGVVVPLLAVVKWLVQLGVVVPLLALVVWLLQPGAVVPLLAVAKESWLQPASRGVCCVKFACVRADVRACGSWCS